MFALTRKCGSDLVASHLPALTRAAAAAAGSSAGKPVMEKEFLVYRWDPEKSDKPEYKSYKVDLNS